MTTSYVPLLAAAALGAVACNKADAYVRPPVPVRTRTVQASPHAHQELRYTGTVAPEAEIELSFKVGGYATSLFTVPDTDGRAPFVQAGERGPPGAAPADPRPAGYCPAAPGTPGGPEGGPAAP